MLMLVFGPQNQRPTESNDTPKVTSPKVANSESNEGRYYGNFTVLGPRLARYQQEFWGKFTLGE